MSFREHAARVPLIVHAPSRFSARRVREPVSLVDVLPTLADIARPGLSGALAHDVDGRTLVPLLEGAAEDPEATAVGEYLAECVPAPMIMIRRGRWKFVHVPGDPDQLFDLDADPLELSNLAADEAQGGRRGRLPRGDPKAVGPRGARARRSGEPACSLDRL